MLYETSAKKPASSPAKTAARPAQHSVKTSPVAGVKKAQSIPSGSAAKHTGATSHTKSAVVKGWPSQQKNAAKTHTPIGHQQKKIMHNAAGVLKPAHSTVKGWPSQHQKNTLKPHGSITAKHPHSLQPGVHKTHTPGVAGYLHHRPVKHTAQGAFKGYPQSAMHTLHSKVRPAQTTVTGWAHHKNVHRPITAVGHQTKNYKHPYWSYYQRTGKPNYYNGYAPIPGYVSGVGVQQPAQAATWVNTTGVQNVPAGCPPVQGYANGNQNTNVSSSQGHVCHNCGSNSKGCTTISRFAFNSAELKPKHLNQIRELATSILNKNLNTVIATGHTDSSGTEDYNEALGGKRASAVIRELRKQLKMLKPGAHRNVFWKTDSKGEAEPVAQNDAAANRRVQICLRRANFMS